MSFERTGFSRADQHFIPSTLNGLSGNDQAAVVEGLSPANMTYLLSEAPSLKLGEAAKKAFFEIIPDGTSSELLVIFILLSNYEDGTNSLTKTEREKIEAHLEAEPLFFTQYFRNKPVIHYIARHCYHLEIPERIDVGWIIGNRIDDAAALLRKVLQKLVEIQNAKKEQKEAGASADKLRAEACTKLIFAVMQKESQETAALFFQLVSDQGLCDAVEIKDVYAAFNSLGKPLCNLALFERVLQLPPKLRDTLFNERNFMYSFNTILKPATAAERKMASDNVIVIVTLLSRHHALSLFSLMQWIKRNPVRNDEGGDVESASIYLGDIQKYIDNPAKSMKKEPDKFIAFVKIHLVDNKTTLDLDQWSKLVTDAMAVCEAKHKITLLMMLVRALLPQPDYYVKAQRLLYTHLKGTQYLDAESNALIGNTYAMAAADCFKPHVLPDEKTRLALAYALNCYAVFSCGVIHLKKAGGKNVNALKPFNQEALACAKKLEALAWSDLSKIIADFTRVGGSEKTLLALATFKYQFEVNINSPEMQAPLVEKMLAVIRREKLELRLATATPASASVQAGHFKSEKSDTPLQVLGELETFLTKIAPKLQPEYAAAAARA